MQRLKDILKDASVSDISFKQVDIKGHSEQKDERRTGYTAKTIRNSPIPDEYKVSFVEVQGEKGTYFYVIAKRIALEETLHKTIELTTSKANAKEMVLKALRNFSNDEVVISCKNSARIDK